MHNMKKIKFGIAGYGKMGKIRERSIERSRDATLISILSSFYASILISLLIIPAYFIAKKFYLT